MFKFYSTVEKDKTLRIEVPEHVLYSANKKQIIEEYNQRNIRDLACI